MKRILTAIVTGLIALAFSTAPFAQTPSGTPPPTPPAPSTAELKDKADNEKPEDKAGKKAGKQQKKTAKKGTRHKKQDDKLRGLDRADEVAGEHGQQGRENARAKQGR